MKVTSLAIPDVCVIEPMVYADERGHFFESFNQAEFERAIGVNITFLQDNQSRSVKNVLRGLHYQIRQPQGKLVRVIQGEIYDVAVDMRKHSPTFGQWVSGILSADNKKQMWIPEGFAHGFFVTSDCAEIIYKCSAYYAPGFERTLLWNDPQLSIHWPLNGINQPVLSEKDSRGVAFTDCDYFE